MNFENSFMYFWEFNSLSSFSCHHWKIHALHWEPSVYFHLHHQPLQRSLTTAILVLISGLDDPREDVGKV